MSFTVSSTDGLGGKGVTLTPKSGSYENVVVWMHGLGDTCDGWAEGMPDLGIPNTKFILPTASARPISLNGGHKMPGWSDIFGLDSSSPEDAAGFSESAARVTALIEQEVSSNNIPHKRVVVAGFSQGGALALHLCLRYPSSPLGGCVALSSWLPLRDDYPAAFSAAQADLPILQVHGDADQVVGHKWGSLSSDLLKTLVTGPSPEFRTIPRMGHSSHPQEMAYVSEFINKVFGQNC